MKSKYRAVKVTNELGTFDSKREYRRYLELAQQLDNGTIKNLQRQVKFVLIPSQRIDGKVVERECSYIADFVYIDDGNVVVEDAKGYRTDAYNIKKKMMLHLYGIQIKEV